MDIGTQSEEKLVEQYKVAFGDSVSEEKLKDYVYYQKLIHDAKNKGRQLPKKRRAPASPSQ